MVGGTIYISRVHVQKRASPGEFARKIENINQPLGRATNIAEKNRHKKRRVSKATSQNNRGISSGSTYTSVYVQVAHLDVATFDLQGVSLQRPMIVHQGSKQRDCPNFSIRSPTLERKVVNKRETKLN